MNAMVDVDQLLDADCGTQSKRIFWDEAVYEQEQEKIFGRCWLFLTHESQIPEPGDFMTTWMGEDPVIVVRQKDGSIGAFINACPHRGNQVCHADSGNARSFVCSYHGWVFGLDGSLVNLPLEHDAYHDRFDKNRWGLMTIAQVQSYRGFVFGCFDENAPPLLDYLGEMAWYMDTFCDSAGGAELIGPPMKSILHCNWKVPTENFIGDAYHIGWTHAAVLSSIGGGLGPMVGNQGLPPFELGVQVTSRHGHGFAAGWGFAPDARRNPARYREFLNQQTPDVERRLGPWRAKLFSAHWDASIFPNCSFLYGTNTFKVWHPRGPHEIEVWTWTLAQKEMSVALRKEIVKDACETFGTAGTFEADDGENMETCTWTGKGRQARRGRINFLMGKGYEGPHPELPGIIGHNFLGETAQRGFYRFWREMMTARDWTQVRANTDWDAIYRQAGGDEFWHKQLEGRQ